MKILFITGNKDKFNQATYYFKNNLPKVVLEQYSNDLPEIQSLSHEEVIADKLESLILKRKDLLNCSIMVEDTSLGLNGLNGFPGPLAKHLIKAIKQEGLVNLVQKIGNNFATAKTMIGFYDPIMQYKEYFSGEIHGIIRPSHEYLGHGFEDVFQPSTSSKTLSEMSDSERMHQNMRGKALDKFGSFISSNY